MVAAGYDGTEYGEEFPTDPERIRKDLDTRDLKLASTFYALNLRSKQTAGAELERAERLARFLASLGGDMLIAADSGDERRRQLAGRVGQSDGLSETQWDCLAKNLMELARRCERIGIRLAFHNHVGTYIETEVELNKLMERTDPEIVGLCYDVGHMLYAGGDVLQLLDSRARRVWYVHVKDVDLDVLKYCREQGLGFHDALRAGIFTELGKGGVDFESFFEKLGNANYSGWLIVEQDTTRKTPFESAKLNREYLRRNFGL